MRFRYIVQYSTPGGKVKQSDCGEFPLVAINMARIGLEEGRYVEANVFVVKESD